MKILHILDNRLPLHSGYTFRSGRISHERIAGMYALIDILAYPRYSMRLTELVTPLKPLKAMAMEKALVASDVGGHKELITDKNPACCFPRAMHSKGCPWKNM